MDNYISQNEFTLFMSLKPMLCRAGRFNELRDYENKNWVAEPKLDGTRALVFLNFEKGTLKIIGRRGNEYTKSLPEFSADELKNYMAIDTKSIVLDGELIANNFDNTASRIHTTDKKKAELLSKLNPIKFFMFDILELDGVNLTNEPLYMRRKILRDRVMVGDLLQAVPQFRENFDDVFNAMIKVTGCEGLVLKHSDSRYISDDRTNWIKVKAVETDDLEIISYDRGKGGSELVLNTEKGRVFVANTSKQEEFFERKPMFVEVEYGEMTKTNKMRFPVFKRFRYDKVNKVSNQIKEMSSPAIRI